MFDTKENTEIKYTFIVDPANQPFIIPRPLQEDSFCKGFIRSIKKKEVDFEFEGMLLSKTETYLNLLKRLEPRFNVFSQFSKLHKFDNKAFLFRYKGKDSLSNQVIFADKPRIRKHISPMIPFYNARKCLLKQKKKRTLVRSRILSLSLYKPRRKTIGIDEILTSVSTSFLGNRVLLERKKLNQKTYKFWLVRNLSLIGVLQGFYLKSWTLKVSFPKNAPKNLENESSVFHLAEYYKQSKIIKSKVGLIKNRVL